MRPWIRWTTTLAGLLLMGIGALATWKVLSPGSGLIVGAVDGWMFEGPALVTFGLLLWWTAGSDGAGRGALDRRGPGLLMQIGLGFMALPAATWAWKEASDSIASTYAWSFAAFSLGVPGVALLLTGMALWMWRTLKGRRADGR